MSTTATTKTQSPFLKLPESIWVESMKYLGFYHVSASVRLVSTRFATISRTWLNSPTGTNSLWLIGIAHQLGLDNKKILDDKGQQMIEKAAELGCKVADAYCDLEGWNGRIPKHGKAVQTLKTLYKQTKSAWCSFLIGYCLYHGYGAEDDKDATRSNHAAAVPYYQHAAALQLCVAQNHLALMILHEEGGIIFSHSICFDLLWSASQQGNCRARYGWAMGDDLSIPDAFSDDLENEVNYRTWCNEDERKKMMQSAAKQGHEEALYECALQSIKEFELIVDDGCGKKRRDVRSKVVLVFHEASKRGHALSQCWLGRIFGDKYFKCQDFDNRKRGSNYYRLSAQNGLPEGMFKIGHDYLYGSGCVERDPKIALAWYTKATELGHVQAGIDAQTLIEAGVTLD